MIYKFRTPVSGDVIMLGAHGDQMLRLIGREPAAQGIIEPQAMPQAIAALEAAVAAQRASAAPPEAPDEVDGDPVGLHQRLWPMIEMLRRAQAADAAVVWGV
jgi:Domain of unknown function (DUF1840)